MKTPPPANTRDVTLPGGIPLRRLCRTLLLLCLLVTTAHGETPDAAGERDTPENLLARTEKAISHILRTAPAGVGVVVNRQLIRVNDYIIELTGYTHDELVGQNVRFLYPNDEEYHRVGLAQRIGFAKHGSARIETRWLHKDGHVIHVSLAASPLTREDPSAGVVFTAQDITAHKRFAYRSRWFFLALGLFLVIQLALIVTLARSLRKQRAAERALRKSESGVRKKLDAILEPGGEIANLELRDVLDVSSLQAVMDDFYVLTRTGMAIVDMAGEVLVATGWQDICTKFHRVHPETARNCVESDLYLSRDVEPGTFRIYQCKNHMHDMVTPIMVGGKQLGNLFLGQFLFEDEEPDIEAFREQARHYGFYESAYLAALERVPRWSRQHVNQTMAFYCRLINLIARLSYAHIKLARTTEALRTSEEKLSALFASMSEMVVLHEMVYDEHGRAIDYRLTDCNTAFTSIMGLSREAVIGKLASQVYGASPPPRLHDYEYVVRTRNPSRFETLLPPPQNKIYAVSVVSPAQDKFATFWADITDVREAQRLVAAKNKELEQFVHVVSHDLRSPLVNVDGYGRELEFAIEDLTHTFRALAPVDPSRQDIIRQTLDDASEALHHIRSGTKQMDSLLRGLLKLSRMGRAAVSIETLDMNTLIRQVALTIDYQVRKKGARLQVEDLPPCQGDPVLVTRIFNNLIDNALKFLDPARRGLITINGYATGNTSVYTVTDNGIGIAAEHQEQIFGLFHRLNPADTEGDGLGLCSVRRMLGRLDGEVWLTSTPGQGSCFFISLPDTTPEE